MATKVTPVTVSDSAYKGVVDVPIDAVIGNTKDRRRRGSSFADVAPTTLVYPEPQSGGTWLGDPVHFDRA